MKALWKIWKACSRVRMPDKRLANLSLRRMQGLATFTRWNSTSTGVGSLRVEEADAALTEIFQHFADKEGYLDINEFLSALKANGIRQTDIRIQNLTEGIMKLRDEGRPKLTRQEFIDLALEEFLLLKKGLTGNFIIPEFQKFTEKINDIAWECKSLTDGEVASYIPQLSRYSPDYWGVALCTIDGQRHSMGDNDVPFCLQSCSKPLAYALAVNDLGADTIHQYVGQEPSGQAFNSLCLDRNNKPHNPMINAGAIVISSLLKNQLALPDRFDYFSMQVSKIAGEEYVGFHNSTFLSERATADRNYALGWFMKENKVFPAGLDLEETLDLYFQICSVEVTCESASIIAATIANGGICPTTGERVLSAEAVRNTLSLMYSCGMYDYSGQFAFKVGLPAKSGVSGAVLLVVPNVMGLCLWSPPLDGNGNSVRAVHFSEKLIDIFNFHNYDNLRYSQTKSDPRKKILDNNVNQVSTIIYAAFNNDTRNLMRYKLSGMDLNMSDYDGRTALHVAASEGHIEATQFLIEKCGVYLEPIDRWGRTPLDDARILKHEKVEDYLNKMISHQKTIQSDSFTSSATQSDKAVDGE